MVTWAPEGRAWLAAALVVVAAAEAAVAELTADVVALLLATAVVVATVTGEAVTGAAVTVAVTVEAVVAVAGPVVPQALSSASAPSARLPRMSPRRERPCPGANSGYCVLCMAFSFHITSEDTSPNRERGFLQTQRASLLLSSIGLPLARLDAIPCDFTPLTARRVFRIME